MTFSSGPARPCGAAARPPKLAGMALFDGFFVTLSLRSF